MMFDEIDTGVSGEISTRMADIMKKMSSHMQIFAITHLPQVASRGHQQFKVYKEDRQGRTYTEMKPLGQEERLHELAQMLGGGGASDAALTHARELLN
jgi:DNA repair protein RecN (Recombination protein N)